MAGLIRRMADAFWPERLEHGQSQSKLMRLPPELRLMIYHYAMIGATEDDEDEEEQDEDGRVELTTLKRPPLTATCRWIEREAMPYYFRHQKFRYTVAVDHEGRVSKALQTKPTKQWLRSAAWRIPIHDVVFSIAFPYVWCLSCGGIHGDTYFLARFDFFSVIGKSGPQMEFTKRQGYLDHINRIGPWQTWFHEWLARGWWDSIDLATKGGLQVRRVGRVSEAVFNLTFLREWTRRDFLFRRRKWDRVELAGLSCNLWAWCAIACESRRKQLEARGGQE